MTEIVTPVDINNDKWVDLVDTVNEVISKLANNVVSTSNTTNGSVNINGSFSANSVFDSGSRVVNTARQINPGTGLSGGGSLANNVTISLNANTIASLAKADTALQNSAFANTVGLKPKITISDIDATGTPSVSTFLAGSGQWLSIITGGDMVKSIYDPNNVSADVYLRSNHNGQIPIDVVLPANTSISYVIGRTATSGNNQYITISTTLSVNTIPIRNANNNIEVGTPTTNNHAVNKLYVDTTANTKLNTSAVSAAGLTFVGLANTQAMRSNIGLDTGNSPQFTAVNIGHATDTTVSRGAAGFLEVEGKRVPSPASQAAGDILYRGASEWERLPKGTSGQYLKQGVDFPEWVTEAESRLGVGQTWQDVKASRSVGTVYQNTSGKPIVVAVGGYNTGTMEVSHNNINWFAVGNWNSNFGLFLQAVVPNEHYYRVSGGTNSSSWSELR